MTLPRLEFFRRHAEYGTLFIRAIIGSFLVYGTQDNVFDWARMLEFRDFLEARGVPSPLVAARKSDSNSSVREFEMC